MSEILEEQIAYYRARATEYDEWWHHQGRYDKGAEINQQWHDEGEIVVLTVDTIDIAIERFIKSRLNYQKLQHKLVVGEEYQVPIIMKA